MNRQYRKSEDRVVIAVPEGRQLNETLVTRAAELNFRVKIECETLTFLNLFRLSAIQIPGTIGLSQIVFEIGADSLYRRRIHGCSIEWQSDTLHPNACNQLGVVVLQQTEDSVQEADRMPSLPWGSTCCVAADVGPFYLRQDSIKRHSRGRKLSVRLARCVTSTKRPPWRGQLVVWQGRTAECSEIPGFVNEATVQRRPPLKKLWPPVGGHRVCRPTGGRQSRVSTDSMPNGSPARQGSVRAPSATPMLRTRCAQCPVRASGARSSALMSGIIDRPSGATGQSTRASRSRRCAWSRSVGGHVLRIASSILLQHFRTVCRSRGR